MLLPGDICLIADPLKTRMTSGGRIKIATATSIIADREIVKYPSSNSLRLYVYGSTGIAQVYPVGSITGSTINILGSVVMSPVPTSMQMWILVDESNENKFRRYRVQSVKEDSNGSYDVIGVLYTDRKFEYVDSNDELDYGRSTKTYYKNRNPALNSKKVNFSIRNLET